MSRATALALLALSVSVWAPAADRQRLTPQTLWSMKRLGSPALAPDGKTVAFTVQEWSIDKNKSTTNLWLTDVASGTSRRLTTASATFYAKSFKTPTLILHGEIDYRVPYGNGLELYGVLQALGVPSRLVVFPNENHWVLSPQNAIYWHYEMQAWLARYIGGTPIEKPTFEGEAGS